MTKNIMTLLDKVKKAAEEENWDFVDENIPKICNTQEAIDWADKTGLKSPDGHIQDAAASMLEKAKIAPKKICTHARKIRQGYGKFSR